MRADRTDVLQIFRAYALRGLARHTVGLLKPVFPSPVKIGIQINFGSLAKRMIGRPLIFKRYHS